MILRDRVLEFVRAPTGLVVELEPFLDRRQLLRLRVVRKEAGMNDRIIGTGHDVICELARPGRNIADDRRRTFGVAGGNALDLAHVAILTGHPLGRRGRGAILAEGLFQANAVQQRHVVTGAAKGR